MSEVTTCARWLGPPARPLLGWMTARRPRATASGVLVLPPVGYEWWSAHRTLRTVAERLADDGHVVLRLDYDGTGDSAGDQADPGRVAAWRESVRAGAAELRELGCERLTLVGARLGGLLALVEAEEVGADAVVAWAPVTSGRRYVRELRLLSTAVPGDEGAVANAGTLFSAGTLEALAALKAPSEAVAAATVVEGGATALEQPAEYATVPEDVVEAVVAAVGPSGAPPFDVPPARPAAELPWRDGRVRESVVALGQRELVGVLTEPPGDGDGDRPVVVFLNSGSEPHVGPGRAWVEYARELAVRGAAALRLDFSGWGESPDHGHAPGRPYDAHGIDEIRDVVVALRERGHRRVVLAGLCAGAWIALRAVLREPVSGVVALNPQLYWEPGHPVEATMAETRRRRAADIERFARGRRRGVWTALDLLGRRPWAARWLDDLAGTGVPVLMLFAEGDDGLEYLNDRVGRRWRSVLRRGAVRVAEIPEIDHSMHRLWLRDAVVTALAGFVEEVA